ncbi:nucleotidyltransferase family protein [Pseudarthrobacter sp. R1]|uniref:nicotine blue oxidoreductase n=1 Tax=Pseudarthrobacter sp. R1 TaxID=2944934 RepID=UPI00210B20C2|nr:nucleotidyltransferase family protein [Pseudarthrobacter sp. R1]MCQ6273030.1 nucleotidyltransferase family protein [Pseudarthrobacter sp. R1]
MGNQGADGTAGLRATGIVLAAGAGTRLGRGPKALPPYRGRPLVESVAGALLDGGCREVVVVLGAGAPDVATIAELDRYLTVVNHEWQSGMGSSFLLADQTADPADHLLIALVDQPGLTRATVGRLLASHRPGRVTAAAYRRREAPDGGKPARHKAGQETGQQDRLFRGHPLLIDASLREAVSATVTGDAGARGFLRAHPDLVDEVDCSDQSTGEDIDTPDQLRLLG